MNIAARIALVAAGAGTAGYAMMKVDGMADRRVEREQQDIDTQTATARTEWSTWTSKLDAQFPGMRLDTPADHARFRDFLSANPQPSWVKVEHEDHTRVRVGANYPLSDDTHSAHAQGAFYAAGFGGLLGFGAAALAGAAILHPPASLFGTIGATAGAAAFATAFGFIGKMAVDEIRGRGITNNDDAVALMREVNFSNPSA